MRLIDADRLVEEWRGKPVDLPIYTPEKVVESIEAAPTVYIPTEDGAPVVPAEWIFDDEEDCFLCSLCEYSALNDYRGLSVPSNFCPTCGAKMKKFVVDIPAWETED